MPIFAQAGCTSAAGRVTKLEDTGAAGTIRVVHVDGDEAITFANQKSIITRVTVSQQGNYQFHKVEVTLELTESISFFALL